MDTCNGWIAIEPPPSTDDPSVARCMLELEGAPDLFAAIAEGNWILTLTPDGGGIGGLEGPLAVEAHESESGDLDVHKSRHGPGVEFDGATGRVDAEADALDEIDAANNQSLVPSSLGMTFCVDGDVDAIEIEGFFRGRYTGT